MRSLRIADDASSLSKQRWCIAAVKRPELARISAYCVSLALNCGSAWSNFVACWKTAIFSTKSCKAKFLEPALFMVLDQMPTVFWKLPAQT